MNWQVKAKSKRQKEEKKRAESSKLSQHINQDKKLDKMDDCF